MAAPAATAEHSHVAAGHTEHAAPATAVMTVLTDAGCDSGLCALMCSLMGMACALTIALFTWALLRARTGGILYLLARLLALADRLPRPHRGTETAITDGVADHPHLIRPQRDPTPDGWPPHARTGRRPPARNA